MARNLAGGRDGYAATLARMDERLNHLEELVEKLVTRQEFTPIRLIVYGLCGSVLIAALSALLGKVIH